MASESKRVKRWAPKVFSGCQTCKRRRVKCDETKPTCTRCARSSLQCEGYAPPQPRIFVPKQKKVARSPQSVSSQDDLKERASSAASSKAGTPDPKTVFTSPSELQHFEYFMKEPAIIFSIYSSNFWTVVIPRAVHSHVAVRHSVIALSMAYRSLVSPDGFSVCEQQLVDHYSAAILTLTQGQATVDIVLITSILFYSIDFLRFSAHEAALSHLEAAYNILQEVKSTPGFKRSEYYGLITEHLQPVIEGTRSGLDHDVLDNVNNAAGLLASYKLRFPETTASRPEAAVDQLQAMLRFLLGQTADIIPSEADVAHCLMELPALFNCVANLGTLPGSPPLRGRLFFIHHVTYTILLRELRQSLGAADCGPEDCLLTSYRFVVEQMQQFLSIPDSELSQHSTPTWDRLGVIGPLFLTVVMSPNEELAARALELLRSANRVEGPWTSGLAANIAEALAQGDAQENLGMGLGTLRFEKMSSTLHIFDDSPEPMFDHYLSVRPAELAALDVNAVQCVVHLYGYQLP
ncbi:uncharacterized protein AB675_5717 [Cyphellophora attinorum]|uniref:Zn(2)-C6 fungal-type domain-containing protein n=1 Tax=Cyphellophora attinorum TaxID=1664694 RepID=A0A0N0NL86_9EURO|nr:uncharacterized protein AB675_5717 [Phialophora attinorum]KPI38749.1 hypothetical protein AB675_5717 [Phialophora attinorum]